MTLDLFGVVIHEADVALTDVGLAVLGGIFAVRLWARRHANIVRRDGALLNAGLASGAFFGALFHAFFPDKTSTTPGFLAWIPVTISIAIAAAAMLVTSARLLAPRLPARARNALAAFYAAVFVGWVLVINEDYGTIVRFYGPALVLLLASTVRESFRATDAPAWRAVSAGLALSILAAVLQQARVELHPLYFDHNALYHLVQGVALVVLYRGLAGVGDIETPSAATS